MTTAAGPADSAHLDIDLGGAREVATAFVRDGTVPCAAIGVVDPAGRSACEFVVGPGGAPERESVFFLASITKAIVATAVMRYVDEDRLDPHLPVARYIPELDGVPAGTVTTWQVLTHTSGLPDMPIESLRHERPTYARSFEFVRESTLLSEPGSAYAYNSVSFILLAECMARLSGTSFPEALSERLTRPLGMDDTTFDARPLRDRLIPVHGFGVDNRIVQEVLMRFLATARLPGGGMFGSLPDMLRLGRALLPADPVDPAARGSRVLSQATIDEMSRNHTEGMTHVSEDGVERAVYQALGWRKPLPAWPGSDRAFTHGGITGGRLWIEPEGGFAVAFLTNRWQAPIEISLAVVEAVYRALR